MVDDTLSTKGLETAADTDDLMDANSISSKAQSRTPTPLPELGGDIDEEGESQDLKMDDNLTRMRQMPQDQPIVPDEAIKRPMETLKPMPESFIIGLENDEVMLEYLQLKHNGDVDRGKYATITSLSMGKCKYPVQCFSPEPLSFQKNAQTIFYIIIHLTHGFFCQSWRVEKINTENTKG
jgi:hypothetical protein